MKQYKRFRLVELTEFAGRGAAIYSIAFDEEADTLYDLFQAEYYEQYPDQVADLGVRLETIAKLGIRESLFTPNEGARWANDGLIALVDLPGKNLRLYCIKFGTTTLIVGGGGPKPKEQNGKQVRAFQDIPKLTDENYQLRALSLIVNRAISERAVWFEGNYLVGQPEFDTDADE